MTDATEPRAGDVRPLTSDERALLDALLRHEFVGVGALRVQARQVQASPGCTCGCGSIDLHVPHTTPRSSAGSPVSMGEVVGADGQLVGGLLLFLEDGRLAGLEVYSYDDPLPMPRPDQVRWYSADHRRPRP
jgi:hypothetical protein